LQKVNSKQARQLAISWFFVRACHVVNGHALSSATRSSASTLRPLTATLTQLAASQRPIPPPSRWKR
jgi:hypothetical protein